MSRFFLAWVVCLGLGGAACSRPAAVVRMAPDQKHPQRLWVEKFNGPGNDVLTQACLRELKTHNVQLANAQPGSDLILSVDIKEYRSGRKQMVVLGQIRAAMGNPQATAVSNPVFSPGSTFVIAQNPHIVLETAALSIVARVRETATGQVVWAYEYSYEQLDLPAVVAIVSQALAQSLKRSIPRLHPSAGTAKPG